ncbi:MAG: hypothetical protein ACI33N_00210 [Desulfovibrionaceae bacterium]|nr:hypothetical protein [Desulfovibrionaceae bacterium]
MSSRKGPAGGCLAGKGSFDAEGGARGAEEWAAGQTSPPEGT